MFCIYTNDTLKIHSFKFIKDVNGGALIIKGTENLSLIFQLSY
jgi:hypothetical protein